jgi:hypothetical protein
MKWPRVTSALSRGVRNGIPENPNSDEFVKNWCYSVTLPGFVSGQACVIYATGFREDAV